MNSYYGTFVGVTITFAGLLFDAYLLSALGGFIIGLNLLASNEVKL